MILKKVFVSWVFRLFLNIFFVPKHFCFLVVPKTVINIINYKYDDNRNEWQNVEFNSIFQHLGASYYKYFRACRVASR